MSNPERGGKEIEVLFRDNLNIEVSTRESDLIEEGLLDSLMLVDLLMFLERDFKIRVSLEDLELDNFRSIAAIESFIDARQAS